MKTKRSYSAADVETLDARQLVPQLATGSIVAIDVAKMKFVAGRGATFDATKLFDTRRLGLSATAKAMAEEICASPVGGSTPLATCEGGAVLV